MKTATLQPSPARRPTPWTALIVALLAAVNLGWIIGDTALAERVARALQFDRSAIAAGQIWRLVTCNLVHYSAAHFWLDLLPWAAIGLLFGRPIGWRWPVATVAAAGAIGLGIWWLMPGMSIYRGFSGIDNTAMALAIWAAWRSAEPARSARLIGVLPRVLVALVAVAWLAKITLEAVTGLPAFAQAGLGDMGLPTPQAHWIGALVGLLACVSNMRWARTGESPQGESV